MREREADDILEVAGERIDLLEALATPRDKPELVDRLGVSRTTVDRAVRELEALGLASGGSEYRLTAAGELVLRSFGAFSDGLADVGRASEVLSFVPPDAPMSPAMVRGATVELAGPPSPTAPLDAVVGIFERVEELWGISTSSTRPGAVFERVEGTARDGVPIRYVLSEGMAEFLRTTYPERFRRLEAEAALETHVIPTLPYGLGAAETTDGPRTFLTVYDDQHVLQGVLINDSEAALEWARGVYEHYRERAEPLTLD